MDKQSKLQETYCYILVSIPLLRKSGKRTQKQGSHRGKKTRAP